MHTCHFILNSLFGVKKTSTSHLFLATFIWSYVCYPILPSEIRKLGLRLNNYTEKPLLVLRPLLGNMLEYHLTTHTLQFLDWHLVFPLFEFLSVNEIYNEKELLGGKLDLLTDTNTVDFAMDVYKNLYSDDTPHALREKRTTVVAQLKQLQAETCLLYTSPSPRD